MSHQTPRTSPERIVMTGPKRVLMLVGNDIRNDTRVLKSALALSDGGLEVTVLGYASGGVREESRLGSVRMLRVPVAWQMRDHAVRHRRQVRRSPMNIAVEPSVRMLQDIWATLRRREAAELGGMSRRRRVKFATLRSQVNRVRAGLSRRLVRLEKVGWRVVDQARNSTGAQAGWRGLLPEMDDYELAFAPATSTDSSATCCTLMTCTWSVSPAVPLRVGVPAARTRSGSTTPTSLSPGCLCTGREPVA